MWVHATDIIGFFVDNDAVCEECAYSYLEEVGADPRQSYDIVELGREYDVDVHPIFASDEWMMMGEHYVFMCQEFLCDGCFAVLDTFHPFEYCENEYKIVHREPVDYEKGCMDESGAMETQDDMGESDYG